MLSGSGLPRFRHIPDRLRRFRLALPKPELSLRGADITLAGRSPDFIQAENGCSTALRYPP